MKCNNCGEEINAGDIFCPGCGMKVVPKEEIELKEAVATGKYDSYSGKRSGVEKVGKSNVYYGKGRFKDGVVKDMMVFLTSNGYDPKVTQKGNDMVIKVEKKNIIKFFLGLNKSATVTFSTSGENLVVSVGEPQWMDKVICFLLGWVTFLIFWLPLLYGIYEQWNLFKMIINEAGSSLMAKS